MLWKILCFLTFCILIPSSVTAICHSCTGAAAPEPTHDCFFDPGQIGTTDDCNSGAVTECKSVWTVDVQNPTYTHDMLRSCGASDDPVGTCVNEQVTERVSYKRTCYCDGENGVCKEDETKEPLVCMTCSSIAACTVNAADIAIGNSTHKSCEFEYDRAFDETGSVFTITGTGASTAEPSGCEVKSADGSAVKDPTETGANAKTVCHRYGTLIPFAKFGSASLICHHCDETDGSNPVACATLPDTTSTNYRWCVGSVTRWRCKTELKTLLDGTVQRKRSCSEAPEDSSHENTCTPPTPIVHSQPITKTCYTDTMKNGDENPKPYIRCSVCTGTKSNPGLCPPRTQETPYEGTLEWCTTPDSEGDIEWCQEEMTTDPDGSFFAVRDCANRPQTVTDRSNCADMTAQPNKAAPQSRTCYIQAPNGGTTDPKPPIMCNVCSGGNCVSKVSDSATHDSSNAWCAVQQVLCRNLLVTAVGAPNTATITTTRSCSNEVDSSDVPIPLECQIENNVPSTGVTKDCYTDQHVELINDHPKGVDSQCETCGTATPDEACATRSSTIPIAWCLNEEPSCSQTFTMNNGVLKGSRGCSSTPATGTTCTDTVVSETQFSKTCQCSNSAGAWNCNDGPGAIEGCLRCNEGTNTDQAQPVGDACIMDLERAFTQHGKVCELGQGRGCQLKKDGNTVLWRTCSGNAVDIVANSTADGLVKCTWSFCNKNSGNSLKISGLALLIGSVGSAFI